MTRVLFSMLLLASPLGCVEEGPEPIYDDDLGLQAVATDDGALAGTWGMKVVNLATAELPLIGEQITGNESYLLVDRSWDGTAYSETHTLCGGRVYDTDATSSFIATDTYQAVGGGAPASVDVDHALGTYAAHDYVELWGLRDLPDAIDTELPVDGAEAQQPPHAERIYDVDGDGHPGATMTVSGALVGDVYFVQRKVHQYEGLVVSADEIIGLLTWTKEQITLDSDNPLLTTNLEQVVHPDPKEQWFQEVRLDGVTDCDGLLDAVDDETIARLRPFD